MDTLLKKILWWQGIMTAQITFWSLLFILWDVREGAQFWLWFSWGFFTFWHVLVFVLIYLKKEPI